MTRANQGGSVLGFVVVAVIMAGLLIGGVYAVKQLTAMPQQQGVDLSKKADEKSSAEQKKPEAPKSDKKTDEPKSEPAPRVSTELPKTGPSESLFGAAIMLAVLSAVAVSYARSRRVELAL